MLLSQVLFEDDELEELDDEFDFFTHCQFDNLYQALHVNVHSPASVHADQLYVISVVVAYVAFATVDDGIVHATVCLFIHDPLTSAYHATHPHSS